MSELYISDAIRYVGVDDTAIDLFESQYPVPNGVSYNSYVTLDRWHWVTIAGLEGDRITVVDNGRIFEMDLKLWYGTTKTRGGFVAALGTGKAFAPIIRRQSVSG